MGQGEAGCDAAVLGEESVGCLLGGAEEALVAAASGNEVCGVVTVEAAFFDGGRTGQGDVRFKEIVDNGGTGELDGCIGGEAQYHGGQAWLVVRVGAVVRAAGLGH